MLVDADFAFGRAPPVDDGTSVERFDLVAGQGDDPFDEILLGTLGELKDDDVAVVGRQTRKEPRVGERHHRAIGRFVDENVIADLERRHHRRARYFESLDDERSQDQGHRDRNAD